MTMTDDDLPLPDDAVEVARITEPWGLKGGFHLRTYAADPQAVFSSRRWFVQPPEGRPRPKDAPPLPKLLRITQVREHGESVVAMAQEVADRNAAEALKGARIFVSRSSFPTADDGEYYWIDLIGLDVVNREGLALGRVERLMDNGAQSILCVLPVGTDAPAGAPASGKPHERLIPFVDAFVDSVDLAARRIVVDWGLDY
jgi:16S rRNA processing protein RimM